MKIQEDGKCTGKITQNAEIMHEKCKPRRIKDPAGQLLPCGKNAIFSIIFFSYFKVALRMSTYRAYGGSFLAYDKVTAVAAFPHRLL